MIERLDIALKNIRKEYKDAYEFEFDNKDDCDIHGTEWLYCSRMRNEIRQLYWIKNSEAKVEFEKGTIIVKYPNQEKIIY